MPADPKAQASFEATLRGLIQRQRTKPTPLPSGLSITGQTAIVTGSNVGLGLEASRQLLTKGLSRLVMGVRSQARGDTAAAKLREEFPDSEVSVWILDMESYDSVRDFAGRCGSLPRIDVVILNAGLITPTYQAAAATGHETTLQVNYLSTVLLALLLVPVLKAKRAAGAPRPPVLTVVGSGGAYNATMEMDGGILEQMDNAKGYGPFPAYARSKMLLTVFVGKLAELVDPSDVLINTSNPGMTDGTSFASDGDVILRWIFRVIHFFLARSPEVGASLYLDATLVRGPESHGKLLSDWTIKPFPELWYTEEGQRFADRLVKETMEELEPVGASLPQGA
ncbi:hypothetical protein KVR01_007674 [Diaporthe batatas]|uniref:uncharacterized protein n=1 Tax=Diaporthe batatas TaxID=748121 RepID=UPI001D0581E9|nr:uncharacterized protein KVR01_007674 [Diaporthe batatas]KAG8161909.1 hypothetical protein KVR01_007674 [Diaporthe batatas]